MTRNVLSVLLLASLATACSGEDAPITPVSGSSSGSTCPTGATITYESFGQAFFKSYCVRCHASDKVGADRHGAPADYNWDQYDSIALHATEIDAMAAGGPRQLNSTMPPGDPRPSDAQRRELGQWLACEFDVGR